MDQRKAVKRKKTAQRVFFCFPILLIISPVNLTYDLVAVSSFRLGTTGLVQSLPKFRCKDSNLIFVWENMILSMKTE